MKKLIGLLWICGLLISCGSTKKPAIAYKKKASKIYVGNSKIGSRQERVVKYAKSYIGTPYKYGGVTKGGMDCSGLVYTSFQKVNINLPRISFDMSKKGKSIKDREIRPGDLVFFKTTHKSKRPINHVGLVSRVHKGTVYFIHSSSSKGVIESSKANPYWNKAYKFAKRIL